MSTLLMILGARFRIVLFKFGSVFKLFDMLFEMTEQWCKYAQLATAVLDNLISDHLLFLALY
jgi:hypothetical protein